MFSQNLIQWRLSEELFQGRSFLPHSLDGVIIEGYLSRCDADLILRNIFRILDQDNGVRISPRDLLMAYSMSTTGTGKTES